MIESGEANAAEVASDEAAVEEAPSDPVAPAPSLPDAPSPETSAEAEAEAEEDTPPAVESSSDDAAAEDTTDASDAAAAAAESTEGTDAPSHHRPASPPGAASIVSEAASMTASSTPAPQQASEDASKPNMATVTSIVNQVLSQKKKGVTADVASLANAEVERFYDPNDGGGGSRSHPWNENGGGNHADEEEALYPSSLPAGAFFSPRKFSPRRPKTRYEFDPHSPEFQDMCESLGIDARSHPHLRRPYRHVPSLGAILRSKGCQYCIIVVGLVGIAIGAAVGISKGYEHSMKRRQELHPHYKEEMEKMAEEKANEKGMGKWWAKEHADAEVSEARPPSGKTAWKHEPPKKMSPEELDALYYKLEDAYLPMWFDRESGWTGTTYKEALDFCGSHDDFVPCPAEVYCPEQTGMGRLIFNEVFDDEKGESWAPIQDAWNEWLQVGNGFRQCAIFSDVHHERPGWGLEGHGKNAEVEKLTGHIMCCLEKPIGDDFPAIEVPTQPDLNAVDLKPPPAHANVSGGPPMHSDVTSPSLESIAESTLTPLEKEIQDTYRPFWFDNNDGWSGGTYEDAQAFCQSIPSGPDRQTFHLCPLKTYCPRGFDVPKPLIYEMDAFGGFQWAPVSNSFNAWVMVGKISGSNTCMTFVDLYHREPEWGIDGTQPNLKRHILCCQVYSGYDGSVQKGDQLPPSEPDVEVPIVQMTPTDVVASPQGLGMDRPHVYASAQPENTQKEGAQPGGAHTGAGNSSPHVGGEKGAQPHPPPSGSSAGDETQQPHQKPAAHQKPSGEPGAQSANAAKTVGVWFHAENGWNSGSHDDAEHYCSRKEVNGKRMELCPYHAYCPSGPSHPPADGRKSHDGEETEQWAPTSNGNQWVMVGMHGNNLSTQCLTHGQLNGSAPYWGLDSTNQARKKSVMCCFTEDS